MAGLNKIMIIGNLGKDPEMRYTPSGVPVTSFSIAVNRTFRGSDGERQDETEWFNVVAWERLAERVNQYLTKGQRAYIEGRFKSRRWEGQDGQSRVTNEIIAQSVLFLGGSGDSDRGGDSVGGGLSEENDLSMPTEAEDLPF